MMSVTIIWANKGRGAQMGNLLGNELVQEQRGNCKSVLVMLVVAFVLAISCSLFAGAQEAYAEPASGTGSSAAMDEERKSLVV